MSEAGKEKFVCTFGGDGHRHYGVYDYGTVSSIEEGRGRYKKFLESDHWEHISASYLKDPETGEIVYDFQAAGEREVECPSCGEECRQEHIDLPGCTANPDCKQ